MGANKNLKIIAFVGYMNDETYIFTLWCDFLYRLIILHNYFYYYVYNNIGTIIV